MTNYVIDCNFKSRPKMNKLRKMFQIKEKMGSLHTAFKNSRTVPWIKDCPGKSTTEGHFIRLLSGLQLYLLYFHACRASSGPSVTYNRRRRMLMSAKMMPLSCRPSRTCRSSPIFLLQVNHQSSSCSACLWFSYIGQYLRRLNRICASFRISASDDQTYSFIAYILK